MWVGKVRWSGMISLPTICCVLLDSLTRADCFWEFVRTIFCYLDFVRNCFPVLMRLPENVVAFYTSFIKNAGFLYLYMWSFMLILSTDKFGSFDMTRSSVGAAHEILQSGLCKTEKSEWYRLNIIPTSPTGKICFMCSHSLWFIERLHLLQFGNWHYQYMEADDKRGRSITLDLPCHTDNSFVPTICSMLQYLNGLLRIKNKAVG